ncbi:MAG: undecaprenyl-diphosphate phosphatase [Candidatus Eisenbacteria bacterium]
MDWLKALILGLVQGLTELLPVSSSGHLVIVERLMRLRLDSVSLEVWLHVGTALGLCFVMRRELLTIVHVFLPAGGRQEKRREGRELLAALVVGTLPAVLVGAAASGAVERLFHDVRLTLAMLSVTGVVLLSTRFAKHKGLRVTPALALAIGAAQAVAILPGISRSGATIATAVLCGIGREEAVRFSFLLSLPAILGGAVLELAGGLPQAGGPGAGFIALASAVACLSSVLAAFSLLHVVRKGKLGYFGYYCLAASGLGFLLLASNVL